MRRLAIVVGALLVALLAAAGARSLLREFRPSWADGEAPAPAAGGGGSGASATDTVLREIYAEHEDPRVGYVLKRDRELAIFDGDIHSDHLGLRRRPGGPPPDDALRIVVLGDSVAFGFGVDDEQALAARLEARLTEIRGPGERPIACRTVAIPSWNHRAASAFLLDHWDELRPEIVLYMPVSNDVYDLDGVRTSGACRVWPDPSEPDPWLTTSVRLPVSNLIHDLFAGQGGRLTIKDLGPDVVLGDVCAESRRRHDENADTIARLDVLLAERGCRLALVWNELGGYTWFMTERLAQRASAPPSFTLFRSGRGEFTLGSDPHPNPLTLDVWARWLALELVERGWVSRGEGHPLEPVPDAYAEARAPPLPAADECRRQADEARRRGAAVLLPAIDFRNGSGLLQVFGGLNKDLTARSRMLAVLSAQGEMLTVELGPIAERPDLYPLPVEVEIAGQPAGSLVVPATGGAFARLPLPPGIDRSQPLEVRLVPARWVVRPSAVVGVCDLISFRPVQLVCSAP